MNFSNDKQRKFSFLNFNLKNEIFGFLPFEQKLLEISVINKAFIYALNQKREIQIFKKKFIDFSFTIKEFTNEEFDSIISQFKGLNLCESEMFEILTSLVKGKFVFYGKATADRKNLGLNLFVLKIILGALVKNKIVKALNLTNNNLGSNRKNIDLIGRFLSQVEDLEVIDLSYNNLYNVEGSIELLFQGFFNKIKANRFETCSESTAINYYGLENYKNSQDLGPCNVGDDQNNLGLGRLSLSNAKFICNLKNLNLENNFLGNNPDYIRALGEALGNPFNCIEELNLNENNLGDNSTNLVYLSQMLLSNKNLKTLKLNFNKIFYNIQNSKLLADGIAKNNSLKKLHLESNSNRNYNNFSPFALSLIENEGLEFLDLSSNYLAEGKNLQCFAEAFTKNKNLKEINLTMNSLQYFDCMKIFCEILKTNKNLKSINLSKNYLGTNDCNSPNSLSLLAHALSDNRSVKALNLSANELSWCSSKNSSFIAHIIQTNKTVEELNLSENFLGVYPKHIEIISHSLNKNDFSNLRKLSLRKNAFGTSPDNIIFLSDALIVNSNITELDLSDNSIGLNYFNILFICEVLKNNSTIQKLNLSENKIGSDSNNMKILCETLKINKSLKKLNLAKNELFSSNENAAFICGIINYNRGLKSINLSFNKLAKCFCNIEIIGNSILSNKTLHKVDLRGNLIEISLESYSLFYRIVKEKRGDMDIKIKD